MQLVWRDITLPLHSQNALQVQTQYPVIVSFGSFYLQRINMYCILIFFIFIFYEIHNPPTPHVLLFYDAPTTPPKPPQKITTDLLVTKEMGGAVVKMKEEIVPGRFLFNHTKWLTSGELLENEDT